MEHKECKKCKITKSVSHFYPRPNHKDGLDSYCKKCVGENAKMSQLKNKKKWFNEDGYINEKEHFNAAIRQYAEVFNLPSLLRHIKK